MSAFVLKRDIVMSKGIFFRRWQGGLPLRIEGSRREVGAHGGEPQRLTASGGKKGKANVCKGRGPEAWADGGRRGKGSCSVPRRTNY